MNQNRVPAGITEGGRFAPETHSEPAVSLTGTAASDLYAKAHDPAATPEAQEQAALEAVKAYLNEGHYDDGWDDAILVQAAKPNQLRRAMVNIGPVEPDGQDHYGEFLADDLLDAYQNDEMEYYAGIYHASRSATADEPDQRLAYELDDPKHPDYVERIARAQAMSAG